MTALGERPTTEQRILTAIWFANHGFGIFPIWSAYPSGMCRCPKGPLCSSPGKHPITLQGFHDSTRDPERIRTLLSAGSEPNYGLVNPDGVFTWDVDGEDWRERLHALEEKYGPLPDTLTTQTANGEHIFLRWPDDVGPRPLGEMFGFVTRWGSGRGAGYVIGPNSIHPSGAVYRRAQGAPAEVAVLPEAWALAALGPPVAPTGGRGLTLTVEEGGYTLPDEVGEGNRYDAIVSYTAHLYNRGWTTDEMWGAVQTQLAPRFRVPLSTTDLRSRFERAIANMPERLGEPRNLPETEGGPKRRRGGNDDDDSGWLPATTDEDFPEDPDPKAYAGLMGEVLDVMADGTDASKIGLYVSALAFIGALIPQAAYWNRTQTSSPYFVLVGRSAVGRKGTAMLRAYDTVGAALGLDVANKVLLDGLNSGEALVSTMHYKREHDRYEPTAALVFEEEYARMLATRQREGATLDQMLRTAFDGGPLSNHRANSRKVVSPPYWLPALVAITPEEIRTRLEGGALLSGSGNRWLYVPVQRRPDAVATGEQAVLPKALTEALVEARKRAVGREARPLDVAPAAVDMLREYHDWLPTVATGLAADLTQRLPVMAFRVAMIHAGVERSTEVTPEYIERGIALTEYGRRGIPWTFGPIIGNADARTLYRRLVAEGGRMARNFATRHVLRDQIRLQTAADELYRLGLAETEVVPTAGRARNDLVLTSHQRGFSAAFRPTPRANVHVQEKAPRESGDSLDVLDESAWVAGRKQDDSGTIAGRKGDESTGGVIKATRPDGEVWCWYFKDHAGQHRDVQTERPWCEICSDAGDEGV